MKKTLLYIFAAALASLFTLQSCGLEEPFNTPQTSVTEGVVELVARPVSYNNHEVSTKADGGFDDAAIHNAFIILFNADGKRILFEEINIAEGQFSVKIDRSLGNVTACVLANVPKNFAEEIIGLTNLNPGTNDNQYINTAVIDIPEYQSGTPMGVPKIDHDNDPNTASKACIPMFGQSSGPIDLSNYTTPYQIEVKRLFAKVTVSLKMNLTNSGSGMQANSYMQMTSYGIYDLPKKVKLTEPTEDDYESAWVKNAGTGSAIQSNSKIYNQDANGYITDLPKELLFNCYVPEYYLLPKSSNTTGFGNEEYKPEMYDKAKHPIYIQLVGSYEPVSGVSQNLIYKIYLGKNAATDFTLKRNTHYTNYLVIKGVENNKDGGNDNLDYRVEISQGNVVSMYGEVANCYMIGKEGTYNFPAYKGAYKYAQFKDAPKCSSKKAKIIARDNSNIWLKDENITVDTDELTGEQIITINVTNGDTNANEDIPTNAAGNAIIALVDDKDNIEWSWHLWFTGGLNWGVAGMEFFEMTTQPYPSNSDLMDRNLGATPSASQQALSQEGVATGLYYKYGCKEPYINGDYKGGGVLYNEQGEKIIPTWSSTKSPTDPCPPGYRVPDSSVWYDSKQSNMDISDNYFTYRPALSIQGISTQPIYYPISGYVYKDSEGIYQIDKSKKITSKDSYIELPIELTKRGDRNKKNSYKFLKIVINESIVDNNLGCVLGTGATGNLYYANRETEKQSKGIQYYLGTYKGLLSGYDWDKTVLTMSIDEFKSNFYAQYLSLEIYKDILQGMENTFSSEMIYTKPTSIDNNGYQVRCMLESTQK